MTKDDWTGFVRRLCERGVKIAIIGGHAVNYYGYLRATEDLDIVFKRDPKAELELLRTLQEFEAFYIGDEIDPTTRLELTYPVSLAYIRSQSLLMVGTSFGYVDIFDFMPGLPDATIDECLESAQLSETLPYVSLEWLKRLKRASDRPRDREDIKHLP
jgi:hypothetical protein